MNEHLHGGGRFCYFLQYLLGKAGLIYEHLKDDTDDWEVLSWFALATLWRLDLEYRVIHQADDISSATGQSSIRHDHELYNTIRL